MDKFSQKSVKTSFFATKSVSALTSNNTAEPSLIFAVINPSDASLVAFLFAVLIPFFLNHSIAFSTFPSDSSSAFLQSSIPAPDLSRSSFIVCDDNPILSPYSTFSVSIEELDFLLESKIVFDKALQ